MSAGAEFQVANSVQVQACPDSPSQGPSLDAFAWPNMSGLHGIADCLNLPAAGAGTMPRVSEQLRHAAQDAWVAANGDMRRAIQLVKQHHEGAGVARPGRLVKRWGQGFPKRRSSRDAPRPGQPRRVEPTDVERAAETLAARYDLNTIRRGFDSFKHALQHSDELRETLERSKVSSGHLLRCIKCTHPELVSRMQPVKAAFNLTQKRARVRDSKKLLMRSDSFGMGQVSSASFHPIWQEQIPGLAAVADRMLSTAMLPTAMSLAGLPVSYAIRTPLQRCNLAFWTSKDKGPFWVGPQTRASLMTPCSELQ